MATTIATPAALAWLMASSVCGITPSSAATTMTAMSVTLAPRARILVKASWRGGAVEGYRLAVVPPPPGPDPLGGPACLGIDDVAAADLVQQRGLAVIDVTHDRHDRSPGNEVLGSVHLPGGLDQFLLGIDTAL